MDYLEETDLCNWKNPEILSIASKLSDGDKQVCARNTFYYVRDNIYYFLESFAKASRTLEIKRGNCYTKSNLLVALLRANGIPARFQFQWIRGVALSDLFPSHFL